jgi:hypothetical protein
MRKLFDHFASRLPLELRVLYGQFLLRVIDLEALSIEADVTGFLGQFAGVLIMISFVFVGRLIYPTLFMDQAHTALFLREMTLQTEQSLITMTFLVTGLITVLSWDATFPDRRDVMVISPLPVRPYIILVAKVSASAAVLSLAVLSLNLPASLVFSSLLGSLNGSVWGVVRFFCAYWFVIAAGSGFLYGSVLTIQAITTLLFPRRISLRISALLQLAAFALFISVYFLEPSTPAFAALTLPQNQGFVLWSPPYWFLALMNQLTGTLPPWLNWLAMRAWIGIGISTTGAALSLLLCYLQTMKRTVEEPDLVPGAGGSHWTPRIGNLLQTALVLFSLRSLTRSRQHRVAFAFFASIVFAIALSMLHAELPPRKTIPVSMDYLIPTFVMMGFATYGLRSIFSLPISLTANWVLRTTQLRAPEKYFAATRITMFLFAVAPVWLVSAALAIPFTPFNAVAGHLVVLALFGSVLVELCLIGLYKVPFTCSFLPGKLNIQIVFWGILVVYLTVVVSFAEFENRALRNPNQLAILVCALVAAIATLWAFNHSRAKSAELYFEELPEELITTLRLISAPPPRTD